MPEHLLLPWITVALLAPLAAALLASRAPNGDAARRWGVLALTVSTVCLLCARWDLERGSLSVPHVEPWFGSVLEHWFGVDELNAVPLPLFAALALGITVLAPRRKVTPQWVVGTLLLAAGTMMAYAAENLVVLTLGWSLAALPFLVGRFFTVPGDQEIPLLARLSLAGSILAVLAAAVLLTLFRPASIADWPEAARLSASTPGNAPWQYAVFILLVLGIFLRKGLLPFHSWMVAAFDRGPLLSLALLANGHLGAYLLARAGIPLLPDVARHWLPIVGDFGLLTAGYTALLALAEPKPRKLLAVLSVSQASFILVGISSGNTDGIAGALTHWQVVAVSTTLLAAVYAGLEARLGTELDSRSFRGLASGAPRMAVFFAVAALALVGLPLTLGFPAEDLLLHGTLGADPRLGIVLPVVTAMNAFSVVRLFARIFLGKPGTEVRGMADALPRERWVLTAGLLFLLVGGVVPGPLLRLPVAAAERLSGVVRPAAPGPHEARLPAPVVAIDR